MVCTKTGHCENSRVIPVFSLSMLGYAADSLSVYSLGAFHHCVSKYVFSLQIHRKSLQLTGLKIIWGTVVKVNLKNSNMVSVTLQFIGTTEMQKVRMQKSSKPCVVFI